MTCIVGLIANSKVYMGGDSAAAWGWDIRTSENPKVFRKGEYLIGYTSSFRMGQILRYHVQFPEYPLGQGSDGMEHIVGVVIPAVRAALKEHGYTQIENNREEGGEFMVGVNGELYVVYSDFQVNQFVDGFAAIGCGAPYALGALSALDSFAAIDAPKECLKIALEAAERFSNGVRSPFSFVFSD